MERCLKDALGKKTEKDVYIEANGLIKRGVQFITNTKLGAIKASDTSKEEYCINSTLHRGYYNPSPVYDIIVGNTKRGRIIANPHSEKITHHYYYDFSNKLVQIDSINQTGTSHTEWLCHEDDITYGFTIDRNKHLAAICKEIYVDGRIISFAIVNCLQNGVEYEWFNYHEENYQYDTDGLCMCNFINVVQHSNFFINKVYSFERKNGFLISYSEYSDITDENKTRYLIKKRRKA